MKKLIYILFFFLAVSCKKDKITPPAPDPCIGLHEVSADFIIEEKSASMVVNTLETETDTAYTKKTIKFTAKEENADYTWYIGSEVLHTKSVERYFDQTHNGQTYPITLVVKKQANVKCHPQDDGYDSIIKTITLVNRNIFNNGVHESVFLAPQPNFEGTYRVKEVNASDSIEFTLDFRFEPNFAYVENVTILSAEDSVLNFKTDDFYWNYRQIKIVDLNNALPLNYPQLQPFRTEPFDLKVDSKRKVVINTGTFTYTTFEKKKLTYYGRKIN
jgi:hypothetical protein